MNARDAYAVAIAVLFLLLVSALLLRLPAAPVAPLPTAAPAGSVLWNDRTFEAVLQGFIILAGAVSILLLLAKRRRKEGSA